jgi:hypothetical protein
LKSCWFNCRRRVDLASFQLRSVGCHVARRRGMRVSETRAIKFAVIFFTSLIASKEATTNSLRWSPLYVHRGPGCLKPSASPVKPIAFCGLEHFVHTSKLKIFAQMEQLFELWIK